MRLRKNMKRTAAAVLALSMAVSAVAAPASAAYICDVSKGDVVVSVDKDGTQSITVGGAKVEKTEDDTDDIIITGDNTKPTESLNAEEENTSEVEKSGENTSEVEKSGENASEVEKSGETEEQAQEPGSLELLAPEDEEKKDEQKKTEQKPADSQEPEQDKKTEKTEKTSDQVIEYGQYDPEAQQEAAKPVVKQETQEKKADEEKTYEATNAPTTLTEKAQAAANNVVSIINNSTNVLKVILRNLKVDAGNTAENAVTVSGTGDVTLELDGKNELKGGSSDDYGKSGISSSGKGKLTIQGKEGSSLSATGGSSTYSGESSIISCGEGIAASSGLDLVNATVTATGGASSSRASGGNGMYVSGGLNIKNSKLTAKGGGQLNPGEDTITGGGLGISLFGKGKLIVGEGSEVIAIGGDDKAVKRNAQGVAALRFWGTGVGCGYEVQKGGKLTAIGGNAESENGNATGGNALEGINCSGTVFSGETMLIGGNAKSSSGKAAGGHAGVYSGQVTVKEGTTTALGGKAESDANTAVNGSSIRTVWNQKIGLSVETGGTLVTAMPGKWDGKGNGITDKIEIKTDGGKIEEMENAKVVKKGDGSITVTGDLVGIKQDDHSYELTATVEPTCTTPGKRVYTCTTHEGETYEVTIDALGHKFVNGVCTRCGAPESNGGSSAVVLTVTGAGAYETSMADGRYIIAVPAENAVLSGCLGNLKELKAQGVNTLVFRTQLRETALNIDSMLSLGVDDTLFTLTHSGESAELTVGGVAHNELLH